MKRYFILLFTTLVLFNFFASPLFGEENKKTIVFFSPALKTDVWWTTASKVMKAACNDLGYELTTYWADRNQYNMVNHLRQVLTQQKKPDAVVFQSHKMNGGPMVRLANDAKVPAFVFNAGLTNDLGRREKYGQPREKLKYWIGQMLPNDEKAGYDIAKTLIQIAREKGLTDNAGKIHMIGISGSMSDYASIERKKGLIKAVKEEKDCILSHVVSATWERERAKSLLLGLKKRFPESQVIWAANDPMALGAIDGMKELNLIPGKDMIAGSVDWIPEALTAIKKGELAVSAGGHYMEAAWIIVLLHDYFNGKDFASEAINFRSDMAILTEKNITPFLNNFQSVNWESIDFTRFTKTDNPGMKNYDFAIEKVFQK